MRLGQWQANDEGVRQYRARQQHLTRQRNGHDEQRRQCQVGREYPFGQAQVLRVDVFHDGHMELPWQADNRHHRHASLDHHRWPVDGFLPVFLEARGEHGLVEKVVETVIQAVGHIRADRQKSEQLHQ